MTGRARRAAGAFAVLAVAGFLTAGCANGDAAAAAASTRKIKQLPADVVPSELLGLKSAQEDMTETLTNVRRSYVDGVGLYSFRQGDLLEATLQVSRFNDNADVGDARFRQTLLSQIGGTIPKPVRVGEDTVYLTSATKQTIAVWFRGRNLLVLAVREDYPQPRALLRAALEIRP